MPPITRRTFLTHAAALAAPLLGTPTRAADPPQPTLTPTVRTGNNTAPPCLIDKSMMGDSRSSG